MVVRPATADDVRRIGELAHALWPDGSVDEHAAHAAAVVALGFEVVDTCVSFRKSL